MVNKNEPLVTVIIAYYKGKKYIEETIQSVVNQTYKNIEIVIVNDSPESVEDTNFINEMQAKYNFTLVHHDFNRGLTNTLITAFRASTGDYISFLGQDDLFIPEKTQLQLDCFNEDDNLVWVFGGLEEVNEKTGKRKASDLTHTINSIKNNTILPALYYKNSFAGLYSQSSMGKREVVAKDIMPLWYKYTGDVWPVSIRLFELYPDRIKLIDKSLFIYRIHDNNSVRDKSRMFALMVPTIIGMCPRDIQKEVLRSKLHLVGIGLFWKKIQRIKKFFFMKKYNKKGQLVIKICKIPVYIKY